MSSQRLAATFATLLSFFSLLAQAAGLDDDLPPRGSRDPEMRVMTWNTLRIGRDRFRIKEAAKLLISADVIALQEVLAGKKGGPKANLALKELRDEMARLAQAKLGFPVRYCWALSDIPDGQDDERYAMLWRNDRIAYVKTDDVLSTEDTDCPETADKLKLNARFSTQIVREAAYQRFRFKPSGKHFHLATIHLVPTKKNPSAEVPYLMRSFIDYNLEKEDGVDPVDPVFESIPLLIMGDFNLSPISSAFTDFKAPQTYAFRSVLGRGMRTSLAETLTKPVGQGLNLANAYDTIWYRGAVRLVGPVKDGPKKVWGRVKNLYDFFGATDETAAGIRSDISDHSPVEADFVLH